MFVVDNFLIIFSLEVGGQFIGWFSVITNGIVLALCIPLLIAVLTDDDLSFLREYMNNVYDSNEATADIDARSFRQFLIWALVFVALISSVYMFASILLIRGTKQRDHRRIKPARNILAILSIISVLLLFLRFSANSVINAVLYVYVFAVIYSLWKKLRDEEESGQRPTNDTQFMPVAVQSKA